jgi:hypothetical protein
MRRLRIQCRASGKGIGSAAFNLHLTESCEIPR